MILIDIVIGTLNLMPDWQDEGIILSNKPYAELHSVTTILTKSHGRHAGLVNAGQSSKLRSMLQPGSLVYAQWRARLDEHLGTFKLEPSKNYFALMMDAPLRLSALSSMCSLLESSLPEREPQPTLWQATIALLQILSLSEMDNEWLNIFLKWELGLLQELGFALKLATCGVTGSTQELAYVSPKSGRAISKPAAGIYVDEQYREEELLNTEQELAAQNFKYISQDYWIGHSFPLFEGNSEKGKKELFLEIKNLLKNEGLTLVNY